MVFVTFYNIAAIALTPICMIPGMSSIGTVLIKGVGLFFQISLIAIYTEGAAKANPELASGFHWIAAVMFIMYLLQDLGDYHKRMRESYIEGEYGTAFHMRDNEGKMLGIAITAAILAIVAQFYPDYFYTVATFWLIEKFYWLTSLPFIGILIAIAGFFVAVGFVFNAVAYSLLLIGGGLYATYDKLHHKTETSALQLADDELDLEDEVPMEIPFGGDKS